jgi:DNA gyrase subunit A
MSDDIFNENVEINTNPVTLEDAIEPRVLEEVMQSSYLTYAMSVIVSRALPDVRDGLKPVHRRIIYVMEKMGLTPGAKYRKSAKVVGDVMGDFHPHGDAAVYDSLVRLAQDFSMRYPLVDGQGNFGSVDGDSAAAMRYTESKMSKVAPFLTKDIEKNTVDFVDNYDGSKQEPRVLPTLIPNLLINGVTGIAVGMATNVPPHNLHEVMNAVLHLIKDPEAEVEDLMNFVTGPDLPTGGIIYGKEDLIMAYKTGRGRVMVRSRATLEEARIIFNEIPYQVNKSETLIKLAELIKDKKIDGIRDVRDESNKDGIRVVVETKRDASPEVVLNLIYKLTDFQININFNLLALVDRGRQPKLLNLKEILQEFVAHRYEVVTRRTQFDLDKTAAELHILDGLKIALDFIDEVVKLIRGSSDKLDASIKLQERFKLSEKQAEAVLNMRLQTLTSLDKSKIETDRLAKLKLVEELLEILGKPAVKTALVIGELKDTLTKFKDERKSKIVDLKPDTQSKEDIIEEEDVLIQLTNSQYIKILPIDSFREQRRGGRGVSSINPKDEDWVKKSLVCSSHDYLLAFTNTGRVFKTRVFDLPGGSRTGRGQAIINYLNLKEGEKVTNILTIDKNEFNNPVGSLVFATKQGIVKRTKIEEYLNINIAGKIAITLDETDQLVDVAHSRDDQDKVILSASNGKTLICKISDLREIGRTSRGVKGIKLSKNEIVISLQLSQFNFVSDESEEDNTPIIETDESDTKIKTYPSLMVITEKGYGKQTDLGEFRMTGRNGKGVKTLKITDKTGNPVLVEILYGNESNLVVTTKNGITIRISPENINQMSRNTQGIKVIRLEEDDTVVSAGIS